MRAALQLYDVHSIPRLEIADGGRGPAYEDQLLYKSLMQRVAEQRSCLCGWHFWFTLILRDRRLSARSPGSASSVETFHPQVDVLYIKFINVMLYCEQLFIEIGVSDSEQSHCNGVDYSFSQNETPSY